MSCSDSEVSRQLRLGEDSNWEFKQVDFKGNRPTRPRRDDWADEIAAFANASGGAVLCGVSESGDVQGMSREQMDLLESLLSEVCTDSINPPVRANIFRRELSAGKSFILVEIPEGQALHESQGGSFIRVGSSKRKMTGEERLRLAQRRGQARFPWFDKQTVDGTGFETLDEALWKPLLSTEGAADPRVALEKMGLLALDQNGTVRATVAGILMCCNVPEQWLSNAHIIATRYRGTDRASGQLDSQTICGPIDKQITLALAFAVRNMQVAARKDPAREDQPQYSRNALFEGIVNAIVHRDYSIRGSTIRLAMFANRLELWSLGGLPNNLTIDSMGERQSTRNEVLTSVLSRMRFDGSRNAVGGRFFMERRGDGVPIMKRETLEVCGALPSFRLLDSEELCVTFPAARLESTPANTLISVGSGSKPLADVEVLALFPNKTWKRAVTDSNGEARLELHSTHLPMVVFAAARGYGAGLEHGWIPEQGHLALALDAVPQGGSVILAEATGEVPGLAGRLNPKRDTLDRTYLYASNISINEGKQQPVYFVFGEHLRLTDANGREKLVCILDIVGRSALLDYRPVPRA